MLLEGRAKLEEVVRSRGRAAARAGDHADVLRFTRLTRPLRLQQEGVELLTGFLRRLVGERAREDYDALVDSFAAAGEGGRAADYLGTLTNLFKDVAAAVDEHLELIRDTFGPGGQAGSLQGWAGGACQSSQAGEQLFWLRRQVSRPSRGGRRRPTAASCSMVVPACIQGQVRGLTWGVRCAAAC